ncbi:5-formyltetrahydrofolate cyclo-ligase [Olsenella sp. HMSC062G07]|uniref:5-formyltetrahydrofolate cyclo-ligase n=1 Tax=Olsenella sp. HMSC062G07 TaxID=1739330 RepID=UPI0008A1DEFB|nr:5-formyltetrahydrofolate cyclo-ligase [Olsenella sp. HMSC062G07]OFK24326.1 5-formyltetrahydrofolate cyclo-ligase [Olsenella sp. HMSC062G07]
MASSTGEDASKSALREGYAEAQRRLTPAHRRRVDGEILRHLEALPAYRDATAVLGYYPYRDEIDVTPVLRRALDKGRTVALPRCVGGDVSLQFVVVGSFDDLAAGARGVLEPTQGEPLDPTLVAGSICLVPGLVFDARGYRVGYGAGYYDNFLARFTGTKVGLVRTLQVSGAPLPIDEHDVAVDLLVSDAAVWGCRSA